MTRMSKAGRSFPHFLFVFSPSTIPLLLCTLLFGNMDKARGQLAFFIEKGQKVIIRMETAILDGALTMG